MGKYISGDKGNQNERRRDAIKTTKFMDRKSIRNRKKVSFQEILLMILIAAIAAPYPLSMFITATPGEQLDNILFNAVSPFLLTP